MEVTRRHAAGLWLFLLASPAAVAIDGDDTALNASLASLLKKAGFTGRIEETLARRLGRPVNQQLADLGRNLWFDKIGGLHSDNACGGCHVPANGFGDTQSIAIGIQKQ